MKDKSPGFLQRMQIRWGLHSARQVIVVLIVFALTGTTVVFLKYPILETFAKEKLWWHYLIYYLLILPIYNVILLFYGFVFGEFNFFWSFERKMFDRMFNRKKDNQ
ncbi:MAG: hypothetical protein OEX02_11215 [Cyclobacteriaceae bacterium]|nr:hypothetical protein [Cyclobacteriaceae bacterium]